MIKVKPHNKMNSAPKCAENLIAKMADTMRELAFAGDNVSPETLAQHGFSREVVDRFGERAVALARRLSVHQVSSHA